jgi:hypothetical protein
MARSVTLELPDDQAEALDSFAATLGATPAEALARLAKEALIHERFPEVEFRESIHGRQAYVVGSSLAVWEVVMVADSYDSDPARTAAHLEWPLARVETVLAYAEAYPVEIGRALEDNRAVSEDQVRMLLPNARWA